MYQGWLYLVAIMDWYSRYVVGWEISNTLDAYFCLEALEKALLKNRPEILNSDQASQFTSNDFIEALERVGVRISIDGRGSVYIKIFIEHLWRTVKYEEVYLYNIKPLKRQRCG